MPSLPSAGAILLQGACYFLKPGEGSGIRFTQARPGVGLAEDALGVLVGSGVWHTLFFVKSLSRLLFSFFLKDPGQWPLP